MVFVTSTFPRLYIVKCEQAWKSFSNYDLAISLFKPIYPSLSELIKADSIRFESICVYLSRSEPIRVAPSIYESLWINSSWFNPILVDLNRFDSIWVDLSLFKPIMTNLRSVLNTSSLLLSNCLNLAKQDLRGQKF